MADMQASDDKKIFADFAEFAAKNEFVPMRELIYRYMREAIITRRFRTGYHLVEEDLAQLLNASRTPVREALRKLESEGLVKHHRRRGVEVRQMTVKDASDVYDLCAVLEGYAARLTAENLNHGDSVLQLQTLLNEMKNAIDSNNTAMEALYHKKWHLTLYESCQNNKLEALLKNYSEYLRLFRTYSVKVPGRIWHSWEEHEKIYRAIEMRDGALAEHCARNHLEMGKESFIMQWENTLKEQLIVDEIFD